MMVPQPAYRPCCHTLLLDPHAYTCRVGLDEHWGMVAREEGVSVEEARWPEKGSNDADDQ